MSMLEERPSGEAVPNASAGRAPVLTFAGLSPFTLEGEVRQSRTEFIQWLRDVHDQRSIVAQYCRYTAKTKTGNNVKQMVNRALQFAMSAPQGPMYLCGVREIMEEAGSISAKSSPLGTGRVISP
jgi:thiamine pyrophosphate-dependent acetolactate synthase large subunit-like protein